MAVVQVYRAPLKTDGYSDQVAGKPVATGDPLTGYYGPNNPSETVSPGEVVAAEGGAVYVRTEAAIDVLDTDELDVDGIRYKVDGVPRDWSGPHGRQGYVIRVSRVKRRV